LRTAANYTGKTSYVLELVSTSTCSACDCEFIARAWDLNVALITVDPQVLDQFVDIAISLDEYVRK